MEIRVFCQAEPLLAGDYFSGEHPVKGGDPSYL
jgi:hypothetical protein